MYAVIMTGGKQYQVNEGDVIFVEKLDAEADTEVVFDQVLMIGKEKTQKIGTPTVKGATVTAKVLKNGKGKKIRVSTYRPIPRLRSLPFLTRRLRPQNPLQKKTSKKAEV